MDLTVNMNILESPQSPMTEEVDAEDSPQKAASDKDLPKDVNDQMIKLETTVDELLMPPPPRTPTADYRDYRIPTLEAIREEYANHPMELLERAIEDEMNVNLTFADEVKSVILFGDSPKEWIRHVYESRDKDNNIVKIRKDVSMDETEPSKIRHSGKIMYYRSKIKQNGTRYVIHTSVEVNLDRPRYADKLSKICIPANVKKERPSAWWGMKIFAEDDLYSYKVACCLRDNYEVNVEVEGHSEVSFAQFQKDIDDLVRPELEKCFDGGVLNLDKVNNPRLDLFYISEEGEDDSIDPEALAKFEDCVSEKIFPYFIV